MGPRDRSSVCMPQPLPRIRRRRSGLAWFGQDEDAYRSHYGARVDLLSRAAGEEFKVRRASLKELVVWNARLRAEGADVAAGRPSWGWITSLD